MVTPTLLSPPVSSSGAGAQPSSWETWVGSGPRSALHFLVHEQYRPALGSVPLCKMGEMVVSPVNTGPSNEFSELPVAAG